MAGNQPKGQNRNQQNRPNTSPSAQGKQQRNRETRPRRPQSSRQQREDKENEGRQNNADVKKEQNNPKQERRSEQSQDGRRKRQRRRGGRDRKPKDNEVVVGDNAKAEPNPKKIEVSVQQEGIVKTSGAANPKTDSNPTQPEVTSPADRKEESVSVNTDNSSDSVETESSTQEVSIKENEDSNTKNDSSVKEVNGTPNHKDEDKVESNALKEEDQETNQNSDIVGESEEIPTALPQRAPRSQGRRRDRIADENEESSSAHDLNGSTNGLNHNNSSSDAETDKTEKSLVENCEKKEDSVSSKPTQVAAPSLINGHEKWLESEPIQLKINQEKENQLEIDSQQASNGNGEECIVER